MTGRGFTLIEIMVVLIITALLTGAAVYSFKRDLRTARLDDVAGQVRDLDALTRQSARVSGRALAIVIDPDTGSLWRVDESDEISQRVTLHRGVRIAEVLQSGARTQGETRIAFSSDGRSPSYAVRLESDDELPRWIAFAGLSGQVVDTTHDAQVQAIFAPLAGHDAD